MMKKSRVWQGCSVVVFLWPGIKLHLGLRDGVCLRVLGWWGVGVVPGLSSGRGGHLIPGDVGLLAQAWSWALYHFHLKKF